MKCQIPEISWHNRDPVLSVDFQPNEGGDSILRLASGGTDSHVLIWYVTINEGVVQLDLAADLTRHQKAVNCVRFSPSGEFLASCDDESAIFIWKLKPDSEMVNICDDVSENDKETWITVKILRGHIDDVYDLSWSQDSQYLISGSIDNTALVWDVQKGKSTAIIKEHKGFVQGVAFDPLNKFLATFCTDRYLRIFDAQTKKNIHRINKSTLPVPSDNPLSGQTVRLFYDDTLQTYFRRLCFSPEGSLLVVPSGVIEVDDATTKPLNATYIYTRYSLKEPAVVLPSPDQYTVAVRFCPLLFELRKSKSPPVFDLPYRMIFAVATKCSVYLYDTQQKLPFGLISNIHYTRLTDLAWSNDGRTLLVSSTDGYCSIIRFSDGELGDIYKTQTIQEIIAAKTAKDEPKKKKKAKKTNENKEEDKEKPVEEKENNGDILMDEIPLNPDISLSDLPESIKEKIPVDKIIKSNDIFSPEKQVGLPVTPIQIRKYPRNMDDDAEMSPLKAEDENVIVKTPKSSNVIPDKTPTRTDCLRFPQPYSTDKFEKKLNPEHAGSVPESPMDRKIPADDTTPKTPRRIEFRTISTPKSKKKLLE